MVFRSSLNMSIGEREYHCRQLEADNQYLQSKVERLENTNRTVEEENSFLKEQLGELGGTVHDYFSGLLCRLSTTRDIAQLLRYFDVLRKPTGCWCDIAGGVHSAECCLIKQILIHRIELRDLGDMGGPPC